MPPTRLLIFGSAKAGTPLMLAAPSVAIDLPLKVVVRHEGAQQVLELPGLPVLEGRRGRRERLSDLHHRDSRGRRPGDQALDVRRRVLRVEDESLDRFRGDLVLDFRFVRGDWVGAFADRLEIAVRRDQVETGAFGQVGGDALGRADPGPCILLLDRVNGVVVVLQPISPIRRALLGDGGCIGRVDLREVRRDAVDDLVDVGRQIPQVRVVALFLAEEVGHGQHRPPRGRVRVHQLRHPGVVAGSVDDHVLRLRDQASVRWRRLVSVRIGVGVDDDAGHLDVGATDLRGDAAPEVLRRDDLDLPSPARVARRVDTTRRQGQHEYEECRDLAQANLLTICRPASDAR